MKMPVWPVKSTNENLTGAIAISLLFSATSSSSRSDPPHPSLSEFSATEGIQFTCKMNVWAVIIISRDLKFITQIWLRFRYVSSHSCRGAVAEMHTCMHVARAKENSTRPLRHPLISIGIEVLLPTSQVASNSHCHSPLTTSVSLILSNQYCTPWKIHRREMRKMQFLQTRWSPQVIVKWSCWNMQLYLCSWLDSTINVFICDTFFWCTVGVKLLNHIILLIR